jgi:hypothetical protein
MIEQKLKLNFDKVALALASCDHQKKQVACGCGEILGCGVAGAATQNR